MKDIIKELYKAIYKEDLIQVQIKEIPCQVMPAVISEKTKGERLYDFALEFYGTDPTPLDKQPDEYACVESLSTILSKFLPGFGISTYTPTFLSLLQADKRFKATNEFKKGNIIINATKTGNGSIVGHCGIIGEAGKILSNSSATGLWTDKFDNLSWIERYSRVGQLSMRLFELI